ncbi:MAG: hypothetical protein ACK5LC_09225 [Coprobacillaceae bacterium]
MNNFEQDTIYEILSCPDSSLDSELDSRIFGLPLSLGESASNTEEYEYAFNILICLCSRKKAQVRANAVLGLAYLARTNGRLDKEIVLPILKEVWAKNTSNRGNILCAIDDINHYLHWNISVDKLS